MKFKFKIQQYQTDAVEAVAGVFAGQPKRTAGTRLRETFDGLPPLCGNREYVL